MKENVGPENGESLLDEIKKLTAAIRYVIGEGGAKKNFDQPYLLRGGDLSSYLIFNPYSIPPELIEPYKLWKLYKKLGPDFYRLRAINPRLLELEGDYPLVLGGSCAIETWGTKLTQPIRNTGPCSALAECLLGLAPTISHVTGAILAARGKIGAHFIEDGLWGQRIEGEYGLSNGMKETKKAYWRIHEAVERRSKLATGNQDYRLIPVNFDELKLLEGPLQRWFAEMGLDFDPNFGIAQVMYTYVGPELLDLVKNALVENHGISWDVLSSYTIAARIKQVDHNDWGASMAPLKRLLFGASPNEGQKELLQQYPYQVGLSIARWVKENFARNPSAPSGFFDLPYNGEIFHMGNFYRPVADPSKVEDLIKYILEDPRLLRYGNLEIHLDYLKGFLDPKSSERQPPTTYTTGASQTTKASKQLEKEAQRIRSKIDNLNRQLIILNTLNQLLQSQELNQYVPEEKNFREAFNYVIERLRRFVRSLEKKYNREINIRDLPAETSIIKIEELDKQDLIRWLWLVNFLINYGKSHNIINPEDEDLQVLKDLCGLGMIDETETMNIKNDLINLFTRDANAINIQKKQRESELDIINSQKPQTTQYKDILRYPPPTIFPLKANLIVMYATQFVFDPDFRKFLEYVYSVASDEGLTRGEQRERIARASQIIFPKLQAYLKYIFEGGEYPLMRFYRIFDPNSL